MTERETMGQKLQRLRMVAGMSQSELAAAAGVPLGTLRNWEQDRRVPLLDTAAQVARTLGVSLDEMVESSPPSGSEKTSARQPKATSMTPVGEREATDRERRRKRRK
jgi:transcriptional regulator with XRE-family HTH domain